MNMSETSVEKRVERDQCCALPVVNNNDMRIKIRILTI